MGGCFCVQITLVIVRLLGHTGLKFMLDHLKSHYKNMGKYGVVGIVNTVVDFAVYTFLIEVFDVYFVFAHIGGFFVAVINSFFLNAIWTFKSLKRDQIVMQIMRFVLIALIGLGLSIITINLAENIIGNVYIAKVMASGVTFLWNYTGASLFVFTNKKND